MAPTAAIARKVKTLVSCMMIERVGLIFRFFVSALWILTPHMEELLLIVVLQSYGINGFLQEQDDMSEMLVFGYLVLSIKCNTIKL